MIELPGGGKAWFVRSRSAARYTIEPCTREGWAVVIGYCLALVALTPLLLDPTNTRIIIYVALSVTFTALFCLVAYRMSAPAPRDTSTTNRRKP